ncbi:MAG: signal peptidase II [Chloroflexi bacterium]|nr:signal peptidase II [Chloroflexota bacterium]
MKNILHFFLAFIIAVSLDALTKAWAEQTLTLYQPMPVLGNWLRFTLGYNTGVTFGLFANSGITPLIITGIILTGIFIWVVLAVWRGEFSGTAVWLLGFILGGAAANFIDRLPDLRVTDFLDMGIGATRWYTFNLADAFIVFGTLTLLLVTLFDRSQTEVVQIDTEIVSGEGE